MYLLMQMNFFSIHTVSTSAINVEDEYVEFTDDVDQKILLSWDLEGVVPYAQLQIQAGTVGITAAQIDSCIVTMS